MKLVQLGKQPPDDLSEQRTERAAMYEYDGGCSRIDAETRAILDNPCNCHGALYWISIHGPILCGSCHPPAGENLVVRRIEVELPEIEE
jgi:hypothetical protein